MGRERHNDVNAGTITTAGKVAAELARRGIAADETVTITIDLDKELIPERRVAHARVVAAGLNDVDINCLIDEARTEQPLIG